MRLTDKEQRHVRTALRFLRHRVGGWQPLADALGTKADTIGKVLRGGRGGDGEPRLQRRAADRRVDRRPAHGGAVVTAHVPALREAA